MAYNDVIPGWMITKLLEGYQYSLPMYTPEYWIDEEYCRSIPDTIKCLKTETGSNWSSHGTIDHPSFTRLRNHLASNGYIDKQDAWVNGDYVIKKFILNGVTFEPGMKFVCASAMHWQLFGKKK